MSAATHTVRTGGHLSELLTRARDHRDISGIFYSDQMGGYLTCIYIEFCIIVCSSVCVPLLKIDSPTNYWLSDWLINYETACDRVFFYFIYHYMYCLSEF